MRRIHICLFLLLGSFVHLFPQDPAIQRDPESEYARMRDLAAAGEYDAAKRVGIQLLEENRAYHDAALYLARIYGWESGFDSAYAILDRVIEMEPGLYEAYATCADLAYWQNNLERLEYCAERAVEVEPDSAGAFDSYITALHQTGPSPQTELFGFYSYDHFAVPYQRHWNMLTAGAEFPFTYGKWIPSINGGYQAGVDAPGSDLQLNLDAYLNLGTLNYLLLGYGISPNGSRNYFPGHRAVAELWQVLPRGFALSAGLRYFYWDQHFTFLTFSAEKYAGNYWFSFRNYLFFKEYGVSGSYYLSARRYFDQAANFATLIVGYGTAPDEPIQVISDLDRLNAVSFRVELSKKVAPAVRILATAGYAREEYADQEYRNRIHLRAGAFIRIGK